MHEVKHDSLLQRVLPPGAWASQNLFWSKFMCLKSTHKKPPTLNLSWLVIL